MVYVFYRTVYGLGRNKFFGQPIIRTLFIRTLFCVIATGYLCSTNGTAKGTAAETETERKLAGIAEIRKRTDSNAASDRQASQSHFEKLRKAASSKGLSELRQPLPKNSDSKDDVRIPEKSSTSEQTPESSLTPAKDSPSKPSSPDSISSHVLHEGPCTPCDLQLPYTTLEPPRSVTLTPSTEQRSPKGSSVPTDVAHAAVESSDRSQRASLHQPSVRSSFDRESTTKPSLPSKRSLSPALGKAQEPLRIGNLKGTTPAELISTSEAPIPTVTWLPPPKISPITPSLNTLAANRTAYRVMQTQPAFAPPEPRKLGYVSRVEMKPLRIGSIGPEKSESYDYTSNFAQQTPPLIDQESLASPSLSDSTPPRTFAPESAGDILDRSVQPAAFQGPENNFGAPPIVTAPIYPPSPINQPSLSAGQVYPAPPVSASNVGNFTGNPSVGLTPQSSYGLPSYPGRGMNTVASGEPYVTPAPRQFDACYMVEPYQANSGCGSPPMANTPPYIGLPGTFIPPTFMPNQVPQGNVSTGSVGLRPLIGLGQQNTNVQFGRGIIGQPKAYIPGQYVRNFVRYLTP